MRNEKPSNKVNAIYKFENLRVEHFYEIIEK